MEQPEICHFCDWAKMGPFDWWTRLLEGLARNPLKYPRAVYLALTPRMYLCLLVASGGGNAIAILRSVAGGVGQDLTESQVDTLNLRLAKRTFKAAGMDIPQIRRKWQAIADCPRHGFAYTMSDIDRIVGV